MNICDRHILDIETHIVSRKSFTQSFTMHLFHNDFTSVVALTGAKVTTMAGLRIPVSSQHTGTVQYHQVCKHPEGTGTEACQLGELVVGYNPKLQALWFHWNCHLYR
jgi:hypothetical protein